MKYILDNEKAKEIFIQIDTKLNLIDVRGESVGNLWIARQLLKELYGCIKEFKEESESQ
jgi:hypothetical protein